MYVLFEVEAQHGVEVEVLRLLLRSRLKLRYGVDIEVEFAIEIRVRLRLRKVTWKTIVEDMKLASTQIAADKIRTRHIARVA